MNIFVLCTGRCGSTTFAQACSYIKNYSTAHESGTGLLTSERFPYPQNHIEVDNRLSWMLGLLEHHYGNDAFYVHLIRDREQTAQSFRRRYAQGIIHAYSTGIIVANPVYAPIDICLDYVDTVNTNIHAFLETKDKKMTVSIESAKSDFSEFWQSISAEGDLTSALAEWDINHNSSKEYSEETDHDQLQTLQLSKEWHRSITKIQKLFRK